MKEMVAHNAIHLFTTLKGMLADGADRVGAVKPHHSDWWLAFAFPLSFAFSPQQPIREGSLEVWVQQPIGEEVYLLSLRNLLDFCTEMLAGVRDRRFVDRTYG